ncbi:LysR substrate-binding domain-containing protein [Halomonas koreensis]|uniref:LysR substrate-binding domain-containing protein n=1 Tax=Halomonas koreensis TaxID=245385 RepID=A0ABU1G0S7_9GAMM|nr:LysR substrate-binding domain-containing protein [Halomonas koreensis]MDR5866193.1 LysR substrate-binding domain-containing protein [Halomonas koreensis]
MRKLPSLKALACFEAASEYHSFTQASRSMNMTHAAISYQIGLIEDWLGAKLFTRSNNGIQLTQNGKKLKDACSYSLSILEETCAGIRDSHGKKVLHVGCASSFLIYWVIPLLSEFNKTSEDLDVVVSTENDIYALFKDRFDLMIADEGINNLSSIASEHLIDNHIGPVCAPEYPFKEGDIFEGHYLLHASSHEKAWKEWARISGTSLDGSMGMTLESLTLCIESAKARLGLAITPRFLVDGSINEGKLVAPFGFLDSGRGTSFYYRNDTEKLHEISGFCQWLRSKIATMEQEQ